MALPFKMGVARVYSAFAREGIADRVTFVGSGRLLGKLWHCTDIMPRTLCGDLELERGSTYAQAAQHLRSIRSVGYRFER